MTWTEFAMDTLVSGLGDQEEPQPKHCYREVCDKSRVQTRVARREVLEWATNSLIAFCDPKGNRVCFGYIESAFLLFTLIKSELLAGNTCAMQKQLWVICN